MSLIGDIGSKLKKDTEEVFMTAAILGAGAIILMFGFTWAGTAVALYAFYRLLPSEAKIVGDATGTPNKAVEAARIAFMRQNESLARSLLQEAGFSADEISEYFVKWEHEMEEHAKKVFGGPIARTSGEVEGGGFRELVEDVVQAPIVLARTLLGIRGRKTVPGTRGKEIKGMHEIVSKEKPGTESGRPAWAEKKKEEEE